MGRRLKKIFAVVVIALLAALSRIDACSTFKIESDNGILFARNYDFEISDGMLVVNKRSMAKSSALRSRPAQWQSRYGSITFNQFGREFPTGGMNEAGLVVDLLWHDAACYPAPDERPAVSGLEWIQYQLDNYGSVDEVIANREKVRIQTAVPLHYLLADAQGHVCAMEVIDRKMTAHSASDLPVHVLTNDTDESSLAQVKKFRGSAGRSRCPRDLLRWKDLFALPPSCRRLREPDHRAAPGSTFWRKWRNHARPVGASCTI